MKVTKIYNQLRRDCDCDLECEGCGKKETVTNAYDDRNYWDNVIPSRPCSECKKSTLELKIKPERIPTKYADYEVV